MARPGVTYHEVSIAAQQLIAAGKNPTIETIRIALGTGSHSTLGAHLRCFKEGQSQTQKIATKEVIPEEFIAVLKGLWEKMMNQSEDKIQLIQQETQQECEQLKQELQRLQKENAHWQQQHAQTKQERDGFSYEKSAIEQLLVNAKMELATLTEKQTGMEKITREKQAHMDELHRQNQQIQANLEHYRNASLEQRITDQQRYEQQQKQLQKTIQQLNQALSHTQEEKSEIQKKYQQNQFEKDSLKMQWDKGEKQNNLLTTELTHTLNELGKQTQTQQYWQAQFHAIQKKSDEQNNVFIELQTQHAIVSQQWLKGEMELKELKDQNKSLAHEKWLLGQEKAQLYGQLKQMELCV